MPEINLHHGDCMDGMKDKPDNFWDLAIVDPPYGIGQDKAAGKRNNGWAKYIHHNKKWDIKPKHEYFLELQRVCINQIIWGGNHFVNFLPMTANWIIWDKMQPEGLSFNMHEMAYCSIKCQAKIFKHSIDKNRATNKQSAKKWERIHPTQKPVALYKWLLKNYAKEGDRILDTHGGSMSIAIACHDLKFDLDLWEIDKDYYDAGVKRFEQHKSQLTIF